MTLSEFCVQYKVTSGTVVAWSGVSRQTLQNWVVNKPVLLEVVVLGVIEKVKQEYAKKNVVGQEGGSE